MQNLDALLARLFSLHPQQIELSLGRMHRLLAAMGSPQKHLPPVIHVAGTNGKGSTVAFLRAILEAAGKSVHVYTSPHLVRFNERIRLGSATGGRLVDDEALVEALRFCEKVNGEEPITFFEATTAVAFHLFSQNPADYLLLEVGLGGRFDATNVVPDPLRTVLTSVSLDHQEFLGETLEKIAFEKAGILKARVTAVVGPQQPQVLKVFEREAARLSAPLMQSGRDYDVREEHGHLIFEDERGLLDLPLPRLAGRHQHENAATAIATLRSLELALPYSAYQHGIAHAEWPARLQNIAKGPVIQLAPEGAELWLDGGHNADGGRVLGQAMADFEEKTSRPLVLICGSLASKDIEGFLHPFKGLAQEVLAVPVHSERKARPAAEIASAAQQVGIQAAACESVEAALRFLAVRDWRVAPRILICGSLYLAGELLALNNMPPA
ncbi:bifunctional folylpolyglutamate synthase/dihydrofolate synthase [Beijerinckia mobilis]|uniref:bifunctional folylpolyglutamate synthase/dihydrofolate synthase n=1 Tax=Beijerinckia mobilis TaxID=231434 RepID=UPI00054F84F4|nr:folylpolyglutamate synthase/dihydrofolate synthase family protein [Beijerinckia mobilis]